MIEWQRLARRGENAVTLRRWRGFYQGREGARCLANARMTRPFQES